MNYTLSGLPFRVQAAIWAVTVLLLLVQSTLIFLSARKRGKNPWFWGFIGLLNIPSSAILYYVFSIYPEKRKERRK